MEVLMNLNDSFKELEDKIIKYLDCKDSILESQYSEVLGDTFKIIKFAKSTYNLWTIKKFDAFLKGLSYDNEPTEEQINKLKDYINSETKAEYVAECFSKILTSSSKKSICVMGIMLNRIIGDDREISYSELICADALTKFFDYDIDNYKTIKEYADKVGKEWFNMDRKIREFCKNKNVNYNGLVMTFDKCLSIQLIDKSSEVDLDIDIDEGEVTWSDADIDESYKFTEPGILLAKYIKYL